MPANTLINFGSFAILTMRWLGFGAALLFNQAFLDTVRHSFRGLPWVVQILIGVWLLPVLLGLWIWQTPWPLWIRLILVMGLGRATLYTFFPRQS